MSWIIRPFECQVCPHTWDDLVKREEENDQKCPKCNGAAKWVICAPAIASYSIMDKDAQMKHLRKRSRDHTRKELKKDPSHAMKQMKIKMKSPV